MLERLKGLFKGLAGVPAVAAPPASPPIPSLISPSVLASLGVVATELWAPVLSKACLAGGITSKRSLAMFLANAVHESQGFKALEENLNYSAEALLRLWPSRFSAELAGLYGRTPAHAALPDPIARIAYGGRMGNAPFPSTDGWDFRGAGIFQLTGRDNHTTCALALGIPLATFPAWIRTPEGAAKSAVWFWNSRGLTLLADADRLTDARRLINGGVIGLESVRVLYNKALAAL